MYRPRYRNEALYPYDGPVAIKRRPDRGRKKLMRKRPMPVKLKQHRNDAEQLK